MLAAAGARFCFSGKERRFRSSLCHPFPFPANARLVLKHKCIHRYVVRAKRGTVQSARDNKSGTSAPKSAGAQIRRYNEAQLEKEIQELLRAWGPLIETCGLIFHRSSVNNRRFLFLSKTAARTGKQGIHRRSAPYGLGCSLSVGS
jgi:hypothetical protein